MDNINFKQYTSKYGKTFDTFIKSSYRELSRYAYLSTAHWKTAIIDTEDLVQEAYIRLFDKLEREPDLAAKFTSEDDALRYLKKIVDYRILEIARSNRYLSRHQFNIEHPDEFDIVDEAVGFDDLIGQQEWLNEALKNLQPRALEILLQSVQGKSIQEIAQRLSMSPGAVRVYISRTKNTLRNWRMKEKEKSESSSLLNIPRKPIEIKFLAGNTSSSHLSIAQRTILQMHIIEHKSYQQIATELGKSRSAIKCQYYRAYRAATAINTKKNNIWTEARLNQLPIKLRDTVKLRFVDGLPCSAIAKKLGVAPSTIRSRINRATHINQSGTPENGKRRYPPEITLSKHALPSEMHYKNLRRTPLTFRSVMIDFYEKKLPIKAIARGDGQTKNITSEGTIKTYLKRGREALDEFIERQLNNSMCDRPKSHEIVTEDDINAVMP